MTINKDYDIRPIAAAMILQAVIEARQGSQAARDWLLGDGLIWLDVCGITYTPAQLRRRLQKRSKAYNRKAPARRLPDNRQLTGKA